MLEVGRIDVFYGDLHVLHDVSVAVGQGEAVGVIGANGHGKSTLLKAVCGLIPIRSGEIRFAGERIEGLEAASLVRRGLVYVAEDRRLFPEMTVYENLVLGAYPPEARRQRRASLDRVFDLYPRLKERRHQRAGTLSGGEAQMLALGRGLMSNARLLAIDEPSLGLAPNLVHDMLETIRQVHQSGTAVLIVEQNLSELKDSVSRIYRLEEGRIADEMRAGEAPAVHKA